MSRKTTSVLKFALLASAAAFVSVGAQAATAQGADSSVSTMSTVVATDASAGAAADKKSEKSDSSSSGSVTGGASSLVNVPSSSPEQASFRVRGVGPSIQGLSIEPDVGVVLDGVVMARGMDRGVTNFGNFPDLANGGLLIGPQGLKGGKVTIAGAVNIETLAPTDHFTGKVNVGIGEAGKLHLAGTVSGPISDTVSARITAFSSHNPGIIHSTANHQDLNGSDSWGISGKTLWKPTSNFDMTFKIDYRNTHGRCCFYTVVASDDSGLKQLLGSSITVGSKNRKTAANETTPYGKEAMFLYLKEHYNFGSATLTSITAWQNYSMHTNNDVDGLDTSDGPIYVGGSSGNYISEWDVNGNVYAVQQQSQEFRLANNPGAAWPFDYVVGVYGLHTNMHQHFHRRRAYCSEGTLGETCDDDNITWQSGESQGYLSDYHIAGFGSVDWHATQRLKFSGGMRLEYQELTVNGTRYGPAQAYPDDDAFASLSSNTGTRRGHDLALTGKFGASYAISNWGNFYGSVSRGYKGIGMSAGTNVDFSSQSILKPETVNTFELGLIARTPDNKYTLNANFFQSNYENMQVQASRANEITGSTENIFTNAGTARSRGFEIKMSQKPFSGFSLREAVTFTEAVFNLDGNACAIEYQAASSATYSSIESAPHDGTCYTVTGSTTYLSNTRKGQMPSSPKWKISVSPRYQHKIMDTQFDGFVQLAANYQSSVIFSLDQDPMLRQKAYTIVNGKIGLINKPQRYNLSLSVNNIFNQMFYTNMQHMTLRKSKTNYSTLQAMIPYGAVRHIQLNFSMNF